MSRLKLIEPGDTVILKGLVVKQIIPSSDVDSTDSRIVEFLCPDGTFMVTYLHESDIESVIPRQLEFGVGSTVTIPKMGGTFEVRFIDGYAITVRSNTRGDSFVIHKNALTVVR